MFSLNSKPETTIGPYTMVVRKHMDINIPKEKQVAPRGFESPTRLTPCTRKNE